MKRFHMINNHDPERGEYGDCLRTCIACLTDVASVDAVPHFADGNPPAVDMWQGVRNWLLDEHNLTVWFTPYGADDPQDVMDAVNALNPGMLYMMMGAAPGGDHIVICRGDALAHDPARMGCGLTGPGSNGAFVVVTLVSDRLVL